MPIKACFNFTGDYYPKGRVYLHTAGIGSYALGNRGDPVKNAQEEFLDQVSIKRTMLLLRGLDYMLGLMWADGTYRMINIFGYKDIKAWPGNPDVVPFVFKGGIYSPNAQLVMCEDTMLILGKEAEFRRTKTNLREYIDCAPPNLGGLEEGMITYTLS